MFSTHPELVLQILRHFCELYVELDFISSKILESALDIIKSTDLNDFVKLVKINSNLIQGYLFDNIDN